MDLVSVLVDVHSWHPPKLPNTLAPFKYMKYLQNLREMFYNTTIEQENNTYHVLGKKFWRNFPNK